MTTLSFTFSARTAHLACDAAVMTRKTIGGTLRAKISRDHFSEPPGKTRAAISRMPVSFPPAAALKRGLRQESFRVISTARLRTSPPVHLPPIDVVVCNDPIRRSYLEVGFVLRCFQHLSVPDAATRPCPWRDNRLAGGRSNTVLSY